MKITDYRVVSCKDCGNGSATFEDVVKILINEGWQPFGSYSYSEGWHNQAIVKYLDKT